MELPGVGAFFELKQLLFCFVLFFQQKLRSVQQAPVKEDFSAKKKFRKAKDLVYPGTFLGWVGRRFRNKHPSSNW